MVARLVFQMLRLAAEIGLLDLRTGKIGLDQVVLRQEIGVLQAQALFHAARIRIGLDADGHGSGCAKRIPDGQTVLVFHMQFPTLLADIGDAEGRHGLAGNLDRLDGGKGEICDIETGRIGNHLLQRLAGVRPPDADGRELFVDIRHRHVEALILGDALDVMVIAGPRIRPVDDAAAIGHADHREVGLHIAFVIEEVGVDALADIGVAANLGRAQPFHQRHMIRPFDIEHVEVRQVDDAAVFAQRQMLGIGNAPEMTAVPFIQTLGNAVAILFQQVFVGGITMGALPAAQFHEVATQFLLALIEGRALDVAGGGIGFTRMHGGEVDLLGRLEAAALDELLFQLVRIEARIIDAGMVDFGSAIGHPVGNQLSIGRAILDPDRHAIPETAHLLAFAAGRATGCRHLQETVEGVAFIIAKLAQDRRQLDSAFQTFKDLVHFKVALGGRQARFMLFQKLTRMAKARIDGFVIAPFDLAALGGFRVARVAHIGRIALIAQQREADFLARAFKLIIRAEEGQRVIDRHDRQVFADHFGNQTAPETGANDDVVGDDRAAMGDDALDTAVLDQQRLRRRIGENLKLAGLFRRIDQLSGNRLRARNDETCIRIEETALHLIFLDQREERLDLRRRRDMHVITQGNKNRLALCFDPGRINSEWEE